jgi:CDP-diacylglycerol--serine O-phosphatidyltransferase
MTWRKIIPNLITLAAMLCAFFSIIASGDGKFMLAAQLIMLCLIMDGLDGNLARYIKGTTKFGAELDTFVDITAYGIAPAVLIHEVTAGEFGFWGTALVGLTVLSGVLRLSRFRVADPFRGQRGYCGLPITVNAGWVTLFIFAWQSGLFSEEHLSLTEGPLATLVWTCSVAFLFLQVSNVRYGKPTKAPLFFLASIFMVLLLFYKLQFAVAAALGMCAYGFFYAVISPFLPKHDLVPEDDEEEEEPVRVRHS